MDNSGAYEEFRFKIVLTMVHNSGWGSMATEVCKDVCFIHSRSRIISSDCDLVLLL